LQIDLFLWCALIWCDDEPADGAGAAAWHGGDGRVVSVVNVVDSGDVGAWETQAGAVGAGGPGPAAPPRQPAAAGAGADRPLSTESLPAPRCFLVACSCMLDRLVRVAASSS